RNVTGVQTCALPISAIQQQLGDPHATDLTIRNIQIFKTGSDLLTEHFPTPYSEHFSVGVQRQLTQNLVLQADFVFRQFMKEEMRSEERRVGKECVSR